MGLFVFGDFALHSGQRSSWKIDCDALSDEDIQTLAHMARSILPPFGDVIGVPRGGLRLADALRGTSFGHRVLVVDDVLTTGASMLRYMKTCGDNPLGLVIFNRSTEPYDRYLANDLYALLVVPHA